MRLASGLEIKNPRKVLLGFVHTSYHIYDGVVVEQDNQLRPTEIALSVMLNSRISGNTGLAIWKARAPVEAALADIPSDVDLLDVPAGGEIPGAGGIEKAITAMCEVHRTKLGVSTKILHKKRPGLIPIFDSVVVGHYRRLCPCPWAASDWGVVAVALTRIVHRDMLSVAGKLRELGEELATNGTPMAACRILNVLTWAEKTGEATSCRSAPSQRG